MLKETVVLQVEGIPICGQLYLPGNGIDFPAVCVCHGIPSGKPPAQDDGGYPLLAERICREGFAVLIFNFRGTGDSGGNLDLPGWTRDLTAAVDYLWGLAAINKSCLSLLGFSGGAAVSVYVAAQDRRVSSVAACACLAEFDSLFKDSEPQATVDYFRDIGAIRDAGFPQSAAEWRYGFSLINPVDHVAGIAPRSLLLVHGNQDKTIPVEHAYRLYDVAGEPKQMVIIDGAGHGLRQDERAITSVLDWLKSRCQH